MRAALPADPWVCHRWWIRVDAGLVRVCFGFVIRGRNSLEN